MSDTAMFIGWGTAVRDREEQATMVFGEASDYWKKLQDAGDIESYDVFMLEPHGGDLTGFAVLKAPDIPSVLIEMGYLSNRTDERLLRQAKHRGRVARSIVRATNVYFARQQALRQP